MQLEGKKIAILGLGIEGAALLEFLKNRVASVTIHDKNSAEKILDKVEGELKEQIQNILDDDSIEKIFGDKYLENLEKYDIVFRSPAIYFRDPALIKARSKGVVISSQMKLFFDLCSCPIIGVTGTKGKGTTSSLIFSILEARVKSEKLKVKSEIQEDQNSKFKIQNSNIYLAGNIGKPAITLIPELTKYDIVILELSNFQLADLDRSPHIAVVTNLGVDHLDYHKDEPE
ncbi:MAG: Mur ligase family protein, partial [bacterium]|nr:Mur ligase family protein [bacterium]